MSQEGDIHELWLAEPTQETLKQLAERSLAVADRIAAVLVEAWEAREFDAFEWPVIAWHLEPRPTEGRIAEAERFGGFEPAYPTPSPTEIRMHSDSAKRPALAERLRQLRAE
jgi:hypothetical protein